MGLRGAKPWRTSGGRGRGRFSAGWPANVRLPLGVEGNLDVSTSGPDCDRWIGSVSVYSLAWHEEWGKAPSDEGGQPAGEAIPLELSLLWALRCEEGDIGLEFGGCFNWVHPRAPENPAWRVRE